MGAKKDFISQLARLERVSRFLLKDLSDRIDFHCEIATTGEDGLEQNKTPKQDQAVLDLEDLSKSFGKFHALEALNLKVQPGQVLALLGPNGAGKTTTMRLIMGILQPSRGKARVMGLDCFAHRDQTKRHIGYLPDEPVFYDYLRGREIWQFVGTMHGLAPEEIAARVEPLLEKLELTDATEEYAANYSKGMKKKLAAICAMLHEPDLLILDEPTNGLDPLATRTMHELIRSQCEKGRSVFFSTHLLDQAQKLCTRAAILHQGRLGAQGDLDELRRLAWRGGDLEDVFFAVTAGAQDSSPSQTPERSEGD